MLTRTGALNRHGGSPCVEKTPLHGINIFRGWKNLSLRRRQNPRRGRNPDRSWRRLRLSSHHA
jgi:hypothetical protein